MRARKIAEGRCVKTMVLMSPICFARDEATRFEMEDMMLVTKNRVPN